MALTNTLFNDPFFNQMERSIDRAFNRAFGDTLALPSMMTPTETGRTGQLRMMPFRSLTTGHPMDVMETPNSYQVVADAPGMVPEEIKVELQDDNKTLLISGEHKEKKEQKDVTMWRQERSFFQFSRSFVLPDNAGIEGITAKLDKGVLTVEVPKNPEAVKKSEPKRIAVHGHNA